MTGRILRIGIVCVIAAMVAIPSSAGNDAIEPEAIQKALNDAYTKYKDLKEGANADYIPPVRHRYRDCRR